MNNRNGRASRGLPGSTPSWLSKGRYCVSRVSHFESIETSHLSPEIGGTRGHRPHRLVDRRQCQPAAHIARVWPSAAPGAEITVGILSSVEAIARLQAGTLESASLRCPGPLRGGKARAMVPRSWNRPKRSTPQWLAERPLDLLQSRDAHVQAHCDVVLAGGFESLGLHAPQLPRSHQKPSRGRTSVNHAASPPQSAETPSWTGSRYAPPGSRCQRAR